MLEIVATTSIPEFDIDMNPANTIIKKLGSNCMDCAKEAERMQWWVYDPRVATINKAVSLILETHQQTHES